MMASKKQPIAGPRVDARPLQPRDKEGNVTNMGLGDISAMQDSPSGLWLDADRAMMDADGAIRPWYGYNRRVRRLRDSSVHGPTGNKIQILVAPQTMIKKTTGHLVAAVDAAAGTEGRVLGLAHNMDGALGSTYVGVPLQFVGTGLSDLSSKGIYTGAEYAEAFIVTIDSADTPDTFTWQIRTDSGTTIGATGVAMTGDWQSLISGVSVKFDATTGHADKDSWTFVVGDRPALAYEMNRVTPNDFVLFNRAGGNLVGMHPFSETIVDRGLAFDKAGIRAPYIAPTVKIATSYESLTDISRTAEGTLQWKSFSSKCTVTQGYTSHSATKNNYVIMDIPHQIGNDKVVAYANMTAEKTLSNSDSMNVNVKCSKKQSHSDISGGHLGSGSGSVTVIITQSSIVNIRFYSGNDCMGTFKEYECAMAYEAGKWTVASGWITYKDTVTYKSIAISVKNWNGGTLSIDEVIPQPETLTSDLFTGSEYWTFLFSWYNNTTKMESYPSPISAGICLNRDDNSGHDGKGVAIDISGFYAEIVDGLLNSPPDGVDAIHVYASISSYGTDSRLNTSSSSASMQVFYRVSPDTGYYLDQLKQTTTITLSNDYALSQVIANNADSQVITATCTQLSSSTQHAVFSLTTTSTNGIYPSTATSGTSYASSNDEMLFLIDDYKASSVYWAVNDTFTITIADVARTDGKIVCVLTDPVDASLITSQSLPNWFTGPLEPGNMLIADRLRLVVAGQPAYSVGTWTFTNGNGVVTPVAGSTVADTIVLDRWMEGRTIKRDADSDDYYIVKVIDQNADGVFDAIFIASDFNETTQAYEGTYSGSTGTGKAHVIGDESSIWWSGYYQYGADNENMSQFNRYKVFPDGQPVVGGGKAFNYLWILSNSQAALFPQNTSAVDDLPASTGTAYTDPIFLPGVGMAARRTWVTLPTGNAMFLGSKGELWEVAGATLSIQRHGASDRLAALLAGWGYLANARMLENSWAEYIANGKDEFLFIQIMTGGSTDDQGAPGVVNKGQDTWAVERTETSGTTESFNGQGIYMSDSFDTSIDTEPMDIEPCQFIRAFFEMPSFASSEMIATISPPDESDTRSTGVINLVSGSNTVDFPPFAYSHSTVSVEVAIGVYGTDKDLFPNAPGGWEVWWENHPPTIYLVTPSTVTTNNEPLVFGGSCVEAASSVNVTAPASDFGIGILIDLKRAAVYLASECPFTCPCASSAGSCTSYVQLPGTNVFGDKYGFVNMMFDDKTVTWGSPSNNFVFAVDSGSPGSSTTANVTQIASTYGLPVDGSGNGLLAGLIVAKVPASKSGAIEYRRITGNTAASLSVKTAWTINPVAGDTIIVGALPAYVQWSATRFPRGGTPVAFGGNYAKGIALSATAPAAGFDPRIELAVYASDDLNVQLTELAAASRARAAGSDFSKGNGKLYVAPVTRKMASYSMTILGGQDAPVKLRDPFVEERSW